MGIQRPTKRVRNLFVFLLGFGLGFSAIAVYCLVDSRNFLNNAARAQGTVVAVEKLYGHPDVLLPVVAFRTANGGRMTFVNKSPHSRFPVGSRVDVLYDRRDPTNARIDTLVERWGLSFLFGVMGIGFLALGTTVLIKMPRALRS